VLHALDSAKLRDRLLLGLALVPAALLAPRIVGQIPLSHDHATHVFKAWHFWTELVPSGRLRGWSHFWGFGSPSDELVPCGGELWVGLFRLLTLGQLSWLRTYAVAFAGLMFFVSYSAYRFGRHFFGAAVGVIAAWLTLLDPGQMLEGGWEWHTEWGVWPVTLAACFLELALVRLDRVLSNASVREVATAGTLVALALVTHQVMLVAFAVTVPILCLARRWGRERARARNLLAALGALVLGASLSGFFVLPFFTHSADTLDLGWLHVPLGVALERLLTGETFQNFAVFLHFLGLLGIALGLLGRARGGRFFAVAALGCVLLASDVLVRTLHLERVLPSLVKLEVNRLLLVAKLFWFPLVGYALSEGVRFAKRWLEALGLGPRAARLVLVGCCAAPLGAPSVTRPLVRNLQRSVTGVAELPDWAALERLAAWSREVRKASSEHYRIAYELWRGNHLPTLMPVLDHTLLYKAGTTPTQIFKNLPRAEHDPELYAALSVKYVVTPEPRPEPWLRFVQRFGDLFVYEFLRYRSDPFTLLGPGHAELVELSPERIVLSLSDTGPNTRLKLHVASYGRWRATQRGAELSIATVPVYGYSYPFLMEVAATNGELVFEYVARPADVVGLLLSLLAVPSLLGVSYILRERRSLVLRVASELGRRRAPLRWLIAALVLVSLALVVWRTRTRRALLPPDSLFQTLEAKDLRFAGAPCEKLEPLVFQCGPARVEADAISAEIWGVHLCMHAPRNGKLELRTERTLGSFLAGSYDSVTRQSNGNIRVAVDGQELASFPTVPPYLQQQFVQFDTRARRGNKARVELELEGSAVDCFDFRLLE
jgi:hypothetical protein